LKLEALRNTKNSPVSEIRADKDFCLQMRKTRSLIPCLKGAKKNGLGAFFKNDNLPVEWRIYDLDYVGKKIQLRVEADDGLDIFVRNSVEG
jgi:hypothetical protein